MILRFTIPGRCVPWMRARSQGRQRYTPAKQRAYQRHVKLAALAVRPASWPLDMRYAVEVVAHEPDARRRDLSNELKTIEDALNGITWADDSQIDALAVVRRIDRASPRVEVTIAPMTLSERDEAYAVIEIGRVSGVAPERAVRIAACEARGGECSCGAGHWARERAEGERA